MDRLKSFKKIAKKKIWDLIIIGGGSSGLGIAVDSASRGYKTLLIDLDPQGSVHHSLGIDNQASLGVREIFSSPEISIHEFFSIISLKMDSTSLKSNIG